MSIPVYGWVVDDTHPAWNGSAISIIPLAADGYYWFKIPAATIGAVVGLNNLFEDSSYRHIDHAFYCSRGFYTVIEQGEMKTTAQAYASTDVFYIMRHLDVVYYMVGQAGQAYYHTDFPFPVPGNVVHKSTLKSVGTVFLDASLYSVTDSVSSFGYVDRLYSLNGQGAVIGDYPVSSPSPVPGHGYSLLGGPQASVLSGDTSSDGANLSLKLSLEAAMVTPTQGVTGAVGYSLFSGAGVHGSSHLSLSFSLEASGGGQADGISYVTLQLPSCLLYAYGSAPQGAEVRPSFTLFSGDHPTGEVNTTLSYSLESAGVALLSSGALLSTPWVTNGYGNTLDALVGAAHQALYSETLPVSQYHEGDYGVRAASHHEAIVSYCLTTQHESFYTQTQPVRAELTSLYKVWGGAQVVEDHSSPYTVSVMKGHLAYYDPSLKVVATNAALFSYNEGARASNAASYVMTTRVVNYHEGDYAILAVNKVSGSNSAFWSLRQDTALVMDVPSFLRVGSRDIVVDDGVLTASQSTSGWTLTARINSLEDYLLLEEGTPIEFHIGPEVFALVVDSRNFTRSSAVSVDLQIVAMSRVKEKDSPYANQGSYMVDTPMSAREAMEYILEEPVDWELLDWQLPGGKVAFEGVTPLEAARKIAEAVGATIQSNLDGSLVVRSLFPVSVKDYEATAPDHVFEDFQDNISASGRGVFTKKFNEFRVSEGESSFKDSLIWEPDEADVTTGILQAYLSPIRDTVTLLNTQEVKTVNFSNLGWAEREETEEVEFRSGQGSVRFPVSSLVGVEWLSSSLGALTFEEMSNTLNSGVGVNGGYGLARVTYKVISVNYRVWGIQDTSVQFILEDAT